MPGTKSQRFSKHVFDRVQHRIAEFSDEGTRLRKYKSLCKRAGGNLRVMGLTQFLTFLAARGQRASEVHHHDLLEDLRLSCGYLGLPTAGDRLKYLATVRELQLPQYMRLTREVLRLLEWHKRLSDIMIEGTVDEHAEEE